MKKTTDCLFDFEVEMTTATEKKVFTIGYSPSREEAEKRTREIHREAVDVRVLRVLVEYAPTSTPLSALTVSWEPEPNHPGRRFVLRDAKGREAASEYEGGHMLTAYNFLVRSESAAAWKTVELLRTLRQGVREDNAACKTIDLEQLLIDGPSKERVAGYLRGARGLDVAHHGVSTF